MSKLHCLYLVRSGFQFLLVLLLIGCSPKNLFVTGYPTTTVTPFQQASQPSAITPTMSHPARTETRGPTEVVPESITTAGTASGSGQSGHAITTPSPLPLPQTTNQEMQFTGNMQSGNLGGILPELDLFLGGGGYGGCSQQPDHPSLDYLSSEKIEIMESVFVATCGWSNYDIVTITVNAPNGGAWSEQQAVMPSIGSYNDIDIFFQPPIDAPSGKYQITFSTPTASVKAAFTVTQPSGPQLYSVSENPFQPVKLPVGPHKLAFISFAPNEQVRLLAYRAGSFTGWQDFTMGRDGRLVVDVAADPSHPGSQYFYYAYGKISGGIYLNWLGDDGGKVDPAHVIGNIYCPGGDPSRLRLGFSARVTHTDGTDLRVHAQPGFQTPIIGHFPEGTEISSVLNQQCKDGTFWWEILLDRTSSGWVAESQKGVYLLEPVK